MKPNEVRAWLTTYLLDQHILEDQETLTPDEAKELVEGAVLAFHEEMKKPSKMDTALFDAFWVAYPRKVSKKTAARAWAKLKVDANMFRRIMASLETVKKTEQWQNIQFIPHPTTWLNGERWNDEVAVSTAPTNSKYDGI